MKVLEETKRFCNLEIQTQYNLSNRSSCVPTVYAFSSQIVSIFPPLELGWWMEMYRPERSHLTCFAEEIKSADFNGSPQTASELKCHYQIQ